MKNNRPVLELSCQQVRPLIFELLEVDKSESSSGQRQLVEAHLLKCEDCQAVQVQEESLTQLLAGKHESDSRAALNSEFRAKLILRNYFSLERKFVEWNDDSVRGWFDGGGRNRGSVGRNAGPL